MPVNSQDYIGENMKTIQVRYLGCTDHKPVRYKAWAKDWGSVTISSKSELSTEENERLAAQTLLDNLKKSDPRYTSKITDFDCSNNLPNGDAVFILQNQTIKAGSNENSN